MYTMYKQCSVSSSVEEGTQTTPPPVKIGLTKSTSTLLKPISRLSRNNSQRMISRNKNSSLDNANTVSFLKETFCRNTIQKVPIARIEMIVKKRQKLPKLKLSNNFRIQKHKNQKSDMLTSTKYKITYIQRSLNLKVPIIQFNYCNPYNRGRQRSLVSVKRTYSSMTYHNQFNLS